MGTVMLKCFVGGVAAILIWLIFEAQAPHDFYSPRWDSFEQNYVFFLGLAIGAAIGGISGWLQGGKRHLAQGAGLGALFGAMGILLGHEIGGKLYQLISPTNTFVTNVIGRTVSFALMGGLLGLGIGSSTFNGKRALQGLIGGALAGAIGGALFDTVSQITSPLIQHVRGDTGRGQSEVGIAGRAFMALILGALIGLFIGLVERISRSAWIRLVLGRNEGREWSIDSPITTMGRSESASIPLFGDANVGAIHAEIQRHGPQTFVLVDAGTPMGTFVNGQRIQTVGLIHGAQIQIGSFQLQFLMKNAAAPNRGPELLRGQMAYPLQGGNPYGPTPQAPAAATGPAPGSLYSSASGGHGPTVAMPGAGMPGAGTPSTGMPSQGMPSQGMPMPGVSNPTMAYNQTVAYGASAAAGGALSIVAIDGPLSGQRFAVVGSLTLGRESAQVPMAYDQQASRRHAEISSGPGILNVQDSGSTNGTFVNGQRISSTQARPGDIIRVGSTSFRVEA
jgi:pSer/pThr/pTyr-binding forkhead associated (FHA) protein